MKKIFCISVVAVALFFAISQAHAASIFDIEFPIPELGGCADRAACKTYCDDLAHKDACVAFAQKFGLVDQKTAEQAKQLPATGPGGCDSQSDCRTYCDDTAHIEECTQFGQDHGLLTKDDVAKSKDFAGKTGPGGCRGADECRQYCSDASHQNECLQFAKRQGLIDDKSAKIAQEVSTDGGPGGCKSADECKTYCADAAHLDECLAFGKAHGLVSSDDAARIKKAGFGTGPGGCQGQDACKTYCADTAHAAECIDFAETHGFMTKEQAAQARKFAGQTGPGGCQGDQCREYCNDPAHTEECLSHAEKNGLISSDEAARAKKFLQVTQEGGPGGCRGTECRDYCQDPAHQDECFQFAKKQGIIKPEDEQQFEAGKKIQQTIQQSGGPGGCTDDTSCRHYCTDPSHAEECVAFGVAHGGMSEKDVRAKLQEFTQKRVDALGEFHPEDQLQQLQQGTLQKFQEFQQLEQQFRKPEFQQGFGQGFIPGQPQGDQGQSDNASGNRQQMPPQVFVGPGGCSSPTECIKYCAGHTEECFSQGQHDRQGEGGKPPGGFPPAFPQLRANILQQVSPSELPENFQQLPESERKQFFMQKFGGGENEDGGNGGSPDQRTTGGQFPGGTPNGQFPGGGATNGEFPGGANPSGGFPEKLNQFPGSTGQSFGGPRSDTKGQPGQQFHGIGPKEGTQGIFDQFTKPSGEEFHQNDFGRRGINSQQPGFFGGQGEQSGFPRSFHIPNEGSLDGQGQFPSDKTGGFDQTVPSGEQKPSSFSMPQPGMMVPSNGQQPAAGTSFPSPSSGGSTGFLQPSSPSPTNFSQPAGEGSFTAPSGSTQFSAPTSGGATFSPPPSGGGSTPPPPPQ